MAKKKTKKKSSKKVSVSDPQDEQLEMFNESDSTTDPRVTDLKDISEEIRGVHLGDMQNRFSLKIARLVESIEGLTVALQKAIEVQQRSDAKREAQRQKYLHRAAALEA